MAFVLATIGLGLSGWLVAADEDPHPPPPIGLYPRLMSPHPTGSENRDPEAEFSWHPDVVPAEGDNYQTPFYFMAMASDPDGDELYLRLDICRRKTPNRYRRKREDLSSPASPTTMSP